MAKKEFSRKFVLILTMLLIIFLTSLMLFTANSKVVASIESNRIFGKNRYATAVEISKNGWPDGSPVVLLARGDDYADALTGVPFAYHLDVPILLTSPHYLHENTKNELVRLGAEKVFIIGGNAAVSPQVEAEISAMGIKIVERIAGKNRFNTAALIAGELAPGGAETAVVAYGHNFPDALAVASYAAQQGFPILLSAKDDLPEDTYKAIKEMGVKNTIVVGGRGVISSNVLNQLPNPTRIGGADRYVTAVRIAEYFDPPADHYYVATGLGFADAIAGGVLAAKMGSGILLVGNSVSVDVSEHLKSKNTSSITIFGGPAAVSNSLEDELTGFVVQVFKGHGKDYTSMFALNEGLLVIETYHDGSSNFITKLLDQGGNWVELVSNVIGPHEGQKAYNVEKGSYLFDVTADGNWKIVVKQPKPTETVSPPLIFTGRGEYVTAFLKLDGLTTFDMEHDGSSNFIVILRDQDGNWIDLLANEIGYFKGNKAIGLTKGTYIIGIAADGNWKIEIN